MKRKKISGNYRAPKQLSFIKSEREFGGTLLFGKRKGARPLSPKSKVHVILKSENARGKFSLINHKSPIEEMISKVSAKFKVKLFKLSVNNNHIHLAAKFVSRMPIMLGFERFRLQ